MKGDGDSGAPARRAAFAVVAHPDDIEFACAGTLLLLGRAGYELHYMNVASGSCGSVQIGPEELREVRGREGQRAAEILGATYHPPLVDDMEIVYDIPTVRRLASVVRAVRPSILITHAPEDYMEDHTNTCRLAVTAAFTKGMPNFPTDPAREPADYDLTLYHAMPHGLCDRLRRRVVPGAFVDTGSVHATKREALAAHASQKDWLDVSQGMGSYLQSMDARSRLLGKMSARFEHAEAFWRHLHYGYAAGDADPMAEALGGAYLVNEAFERTCVQEYY